MIRSNAAVVTQKPGGTLTPSIRASPARPAPLPPTTATSVASMSSISSKASASSVVGTVIARIHSTPKLLAARPHPRTTLEVAGECPGNPAPRVTIELAAPLADREVRDGLFVAPITELVDG